MARRTDTKVFKREIRRALTITCDHVTSDEDGDEIEVTVHGGGVELFDPLYVSFKDAADADDAAYALSMDIDIDDETLIRAFAFEAEGDGEDDEQEERFEDGRAALENIVCEAIGEKVAAYFAKL